MSFAVPATRPIFKTPFRRYRRPRTLWICDQALDCCLGPDRYPLPLWLADWFSVERGTTRCSSPARVPDRTGRHVNRRSFPRIRFPVISGALIAEEPITGRVRLAWIDHCWRVYVGFDAFTALRSTN
jgi:hypothetical protein